MESSPHNQFWLAVGRFAHQLELDHGHNAHNYATKLALKALQDGKNGDVEFWEAVSSSLKPRMPDQSQNTPQEQAKQSLMNTNIPTVQQRLAELKATGVAPIHAIKTIHAEFGLSLAEAKGEFSHSTAWQEEARNADQLHADLIAVLANEPRREAGDA